MSVAGEKVWLVAVWVEPVEPEPGQRPVVSNHLYASAASAANGLRDQLDELVGDDMPAELFEGDFDGEIETYWGGPFTIDDKRIDYLVTALTVEE